MASEQLKCQERSPHKSFITVLSVVIIIPKGRGFKSSVVSIGHNSVYGAQISCQIPGFISTSKTNEKGISNLQKGQNV